MSLEIDLDRVTAVLLADGWHQCVPGSLEFDDDASVPLTAFRFQEAAPKPFATGMPAVKTYAGPLSSILAVGMEGGS